jgi:YNFM family putative membrane transporter
VVTSPPAEGLAPPAIRAIAFAGACTFIDLYATQPILPVLEREFGVDEVQASLTVSAPTMAVALAAPLFGVIASRTRRRAVIVPGLIALGLSTLLVFTAESLGALLAWRFIEGLAISAVYVFVLAYVGEESTASDVGRAMSAFVSGNVVGGFAGRTIVGLLTDLAGWRSAFVGLGLINLVGAVTTWLWLPPSRRLVVGAPRVRDRTAPSAAWRALRDPRLVATFVVGFDVLFALVAAFTYVVFHLHAAPFALSTSAISAIFAVYLIGAAATPAAGPIIDRAGPRRVLIAATSAASLGMVLTLAPVVPVIVLGLALAATGAFVSQSAATSFLRTAAPLEHRALASGVYVAAYYLGGSAAGVVPGLLWEMSGWPGCVAIVLAAQALTLGVATWAWRPRGSSRRAP